jgi:hypothetical protein
VVGTGKLDLNFVNEGTDLRYRRLVAVERQATVLRPDQHAQAEYDIYDRQTWKQERVKWVGEDDPRLPNIATPENVSPPPYYPDHPVVRQEWARYLNTTSLMDFHVGRILQQLEDEGTLEDTVVFFFADNGRMEPRGIHWCYDSGLHVPMIIRWPKNFPAPPQIQPGGVIEDVVSLLDITATTMAVAGLDRPAGCPAATCWATARRAAANVRVQRPRPHRRDAGSSAHGARRALALHPQRSALRHRRLAEPLQGEVLSDHAADAPHARRRRTDRSAAGSDGRTCAGRRSCTTPGPIRTRLSTWPIRPNRSTAKPCCVCEPPWTPGSSRPATAATFPNRPRSSLLSPKKCTTGSAPPPGIGPPFTPQFSDSDLYGNDSKIGQELRDEAVWDVFFTKLSGVQEYGFHSGIEPLMWASDQLDDALVALDWPGLRDELRTKAPEWMEMVIQHASDEGAFFPPQPEPEEAEAVESY